MSTSTKILSTPKKKFFMTIAELKVKPFAERLQLMEDLWETLSNEDNNLQSPAWHQEILEERMDLINTGQAEYVTIEELKKRIQPGECK
ncbi:addiction module protein [Pelodictyon phaeoclathratiforme]|jgi:putative addiction module component (TIGR02574 family)|nr:addiction module protein [Pelodictyon phaeoclathratiforme]